MSRPLTRTQALENRAFLKALRRTGNVRLACREVGLKYGTMQHRRRVHPAFAVRWDAAVAFASAQLEERLRKGMGHGTESHDHVGRVRLPSGSPPRRPADAVSRHNDARFAPLTLCSAARTKGGEPHLVRLRSGKLQMRRAQAGKLTREAEQGFLAALSATCNMSLAAAAVGADPHAFYRRRKKDPGFAREVRLALKRGYFELETALLYSSLPESHEHDDWRNNAPPAMPPMTSNQALQLLYLHQKEARLTAEPWWLKRRRGESREAHSERLALMAEERDRLRREEFEIAEAERWAEGLPPWGPAGEDVRRKLGLSEEGPSTASGPPPLEIEGRMSLPDLAQVTGWSRADLKKALHDPDVALFGGWRIEQMEEKLERRAWGEEDD